MTKDDAKIIANRIWRDLPAGYGMVAAIVEVIEALGLIKFDKPMTATERALTAINEYARRDGIYVDVIPNGKELIELMNVANVKIVDK